MDQQQDQPIPINVYLKNDYSKVIVNIYNEQGVFLWRLKYDGSEYVKPPPFSPPFSPLYIATSPNPPPSPPNFAPPPDHIIQPPPSPPADWLPRAAQPSPPAYESNVDSYYDWNTLENGWLQVFLNHRVFCQFLSLFPTHAIHNRHYLVHQCSARLQYKEKIFPPTNIECKILFLIIICVHIIKR